MHKITFYVCSCIYRLLLCVDIYVIFIRGRNYLTTNVSHVTENKIRDLLQELYIIESCGKNILHKILCKQEGNANPDCLPHTAVAIKFALGGRGGRVQKEIFFSGCGVQKYNKNITGGRGSSTNFDHAGGGVVFNQL